MTYRHDVTNGPISNLLPLRERPISKAKMITRLLLKIVKASTEKDHSLQTARSIVSKMSPRSVVAVTDFHSAQHPASQH